MKDEYKILIGAIIVILIVLVGAYAMSGSGNPGPGVSPTAEPSTSPTPTAVPGGEGGNMPSATPTAVPTTEPSPVPTTEPESGVKLTEFGYWITYPPLGPQNWSTNPPPSQGEWNVVYFDPTSDRIVLNGVSGERREREYYSNAIVHRYGNMSGTVHATIHSSGYGYGLMPMIHAGDYYLSNSEGNLSYAGSSNWTLTFGPNVSEQTVVVEVFPEVTDEPYDLYVDLTILSADGGYSPGYNKDYRVDIVELPEVYYDYESYPDVYLYYTGGTIICNGDFEAFDNSSPDKVYVTIAVNRTDDHGDLPVSIDPYCETLEPGEYSIDGLTIADGHPGGLLRVGIDKDAIFNNEFHTLSIDIVGTENYVPGYPSELEVHTGIS